MFIKQILFALLMHWKKIICAMILCAAVAGIFNYYFIDEMYQASSQIYISSNDSVDNGQMIKLNHASIVDYEEILGSRTVLKKVINELKLDINYKELREMILISSDRDSNYLDISVTCHEPKLAVEINECLVRTGLEQVYRIIGHEESSVIDIAEVDDVVSMKESLLKYTLLGAMVGAVAMCGFIILEKHISSERAG